MSAFSEESSGRMVCSSEKWFDSINNLAPRGGASLITTPDFILLFGGANREQEHFNDVWVYSKKTASKKKPKWVKVECTGDVPPPRSGQAVCTYMGSVFLFGGMDAENEAIYNDLYSLDTAKWEWNYVGEAGETITARNSHSLHIVVTPDHAGSEQGDEQSGTSYLVLFGGSSPELGPLGDTYYAELPAEGITNVTEFYVTWRCLSSSGVAPCPREMHSSAVLSGGDGLLIAGGRTVDSVLSDVWLLTASSPLSQPPIDEKAVASYIPSTEKEATSSSSSEVDPATLISVLTTPSTSSTDASIDVSNVQPEATTKSTGESASASTGARHPLAWSRVSALELPHPRCAHTSVVSADDLILFGGFTGQGISEDLIIARSVSEILATSSSREASSNSIEKELSPSELLSQPCSDHWVCLDTSRAIDGRFAHAMANVSLSVVKKEETDKSGILIFGGINATQDFNDMWVLSALRQKE